MTRGRLSAGIGFLALLQCIPSPTYGQFAARITGAVLDASGGAIPGAGITAQNQGTGIRWETSSNDLGIYSVPVLQPGPYRIQVQCDGFRAISRSGIDVESGQTAKIDFVLEVGAVTEMVEVTADLLQLQSETPEVGTRLSQRQLMSLPLSIGGSRRAEIFAYKITPGVYGNSWKNYIVGSTAFSKETLLDGVSATTNRAGHFGEQSVSVEAIQEFKILTSGLSAEYGRTQAGLFTYVMKSGANAPHGSLFGAFRNEALNANTFVNNSLGKGRELDRKYNYAASLGGPVSIPKLYSGRDRSFFYVAFERYIERQPGIGGLTRTVPVASFYEGDLSRLLQQSVAGTDALGNPVLKGAVFDPATFYQLPDGRWMGQMFPQNVIPASRISAVSQRMNAIARQHYLPSVRTASGEVPLVNNATFPEAGITELDQHQFSIKADQIIQDHQKLSFSYAHNLRPRLTAQPNGPDSMWNAGSRTGGLLSRARTQRLTSHFARLAYDWPVSPRLLFRGVAYLNRFVNDNANAHRHTDGAAEIGLTGLSSEGFPDVYWGGGPFVTLATPGSTYVQDDATTVAGLQTSASYGWRTHFLKGGFEFRRAYGEILVTPQPRIDFHARATAIPNEAFSGNLTGHSFASYLLGIVDQAGLNDPISLGYRRNSFALFVQDDYKVSRRLSLQLGLRWEMNSPVTEARGRISSWNPEKIDPASGLPGAYEFAGHCPACTGRSFFGRRDWNNFGPRVGFAWQPLAKWTLRGAYGVLYEADAQTSGILGRRSYSGWVGSYDLSPDPVAPWRGIFQWDDGFPAAERYVPASYDPSWGSRFAPGMIDPEYGVSPYIQRWNFNVQYEIARSFLLDIGYLGAKATKLRGGRLKQLNQLPPSVLAEYGATLNNPVRSEAEARANGIPYPYPGFTGTVASALRPFPQVDGNATVTVYGAPLGFSNTHALQVVLNRQFSEGLTMYVNYVWSKTLTNVQSSVESEEINRPLDYYNLGLEKSVAPYDVPHMFKAYVSYDLPFGQGRRFWSGAGRVGNFLAGGWSVSAILNYFSGTPLGFEASSPLQGGWNGAGARANVEEGPLTSAAFELSQFELSDLSSPVNTYLTPDLYSDPAPLTLGTSAYRYAQAREFGTVSEDIGIQKDHWFDENFRLQFRAELLNAFNRPRLGGIQTLVTHPLFGQVTKVTGNRLIQVGVRLDF